MTQWSANLAMTKWDANLQKSRHCEDFSPKQSTNATFETYANLELLANLNAIIYRFALAILR